MTTKSLNTKKASSVKTIVFIVLGIFALIGLLVLLLIGGVVGLFTYGMNMAEEEFRLQLEDDIIVTKHLGSIEEVDMELMEAAKQSGPNEDKFLLRVVGSKASGVIILKTVNINRNGEIVTESTRNLKLDNGQVINLPLATGIWNAIELEHTRSIQRLLDAGVDVNSKNEQGWSVLDMALTTKNKECIALIKAHGGKSNANQSIFIASGIGDIEAVKQHFASGVDVSVRDDNGWTALHYASDRKIIARFLIDKGAKLNAINNDGETPLDRAIDWEDSETADLLRKHGGKTSEEMK
jgi:ankyrin repeat protein|tara:strand:- start:62 stop:946 length:885 start_codon:yes stop_codon:yes gene_type:complete